MTRIVIAGCRDYNNYEEAEEFIDLCVSSFAGKDNIVIVSGGAKGADMLGERYASERGFAIERYNADWKTYGRKAGPMRNNQMAEICDLVICFWDEKSKGTGSMIALAKKHGKKVFIKRIR
jgi:hypothetical protein